MNYGQLIGELRMRLADAQEGGGSAPTKPPLAMKRSKRGGQVLELIREHGPMDCRGQAAALGIEVNNAAMLLTNMIRANQVKRDGTRGSYRYSLP